MCGEYPGIQSRKAQRSIGTKAYLYKTHVSEGEKSYNDLETWKTDKKQSNLVKI